LAAAIIARIKASAKGLPSALPVLVGPEGERAERSGAAVAEGAARELPNLFLTEQQAKHAAGREAADGSARNGKAGAALTRRLSAHGAHGTVDQIADTASFLGLRRIHYAGRDRVPAPQVGENIGSEELFEQLLRIHLGTPFAARAS